MSFFTLIFGEKPQPRPLFIDTPPQRARWRRVRPKEEQRPVHAWRAEADHRINTHTGSMEARGGQDFIVENANGDHRVIRGDIFERTYEPQGDDLYRKRDDVELRYFTLDHPALVKTLEGDQHAKPGDWIIQGVAGELWPVPREEAERKYEPV